VYGTHILKSCPEISRGEAGRQAIDDRDDRVANRHWVVFRLESLGTRADRYFIVSFSPQDTRGDPVEFCAHFRSRGRGPGDEDDDDDDDDDSCSQRPA